MAGYSDILMDHFESPRNCAVMEDAHGVGRADLGGRAPRMKLYVRLDGGRIQHCTFQTAGCGAAIATCSLLTELVSGETIKRGLAITPKELDEALEILPASKKFCVDLAVLALRDALKRAVLDREAGNP